MNDQSESRPDNGQVSHSAGAPRARLSRILLAALRLGATTLGVIVSLGVLGSLVYLAWLMPSTPDMRSLKQIRIPEPSVLLAADGTRLSLLNRVQQQRVPLERISPHVIAALIATEDKRFYDHRGIDIRRTVSAVLHTMGGDDQGGSTITQQLARNLYPEEIGRSRSINRKAKEMITALRLEEAYSKQQILELYLNTVPFLYNVFGIEMAARTYFDKPAADLNEIESATLVGMLKGTRYYNPITNPQRALKRRNVVLQQMVRANVLPADMLAPLSALPLGAHLNRQTETPDANSHFVAYVRRWLNDWAERHGYDPYADGLVIETSLDPELQAAAVHAVDVQTALLQQIADVEWGRNSSAVAENPNTYKQLHKHIEPFSYLWKSRPDLVEAFIRETPEYRKAIAGGKSDSQAIEKLKGRSHFMQRLLSAKSRLETGFVAIDPNSGEVKAWVGSRDFRRDQFDHVAQAVRQPGSTFKPFVYGAALEMGLSPERIYESGPVTIRLTDGGVWQPTDMTGNSGPMTLRQGLVYSKNTVTAQVMQDVGISNVITLAQALGVRQSKLDPVVSLALGTSPVTLLEMVSAYSTIATIGDYRAPVFVRRIRDASGKVIADFTARQPERVMSAQASIELIDIMRGAVTQGTGQFIKRRFGITADVAGKTGTTQFNTDGWFILMHPNLVAGAWVGFNDQRITMRSNYWGQGGHNAILVVGDFFRDILKSRRIDAKAHFPKPPRMPVMASTAPPSEDAVRFEIRDSDGTLISSDFPEPGHGVIVRRSDGGSTFVGDARGIELLEGQARETPPKTAEELARIMSGMGRDPDTGMRSEGGASQSGASGSPSVITTSPR